MRLVDHDPVRATRARAALQQPREQGGKEGGTLLERDAEHVHDHVLVAGDEQLDDLLGLGRRLLVAEHDRVLEGGVVALRVDQAELVPLLGQTLDEARGQRRLAAARGAGQEQPAAVRVHGHGRVAGIVAELDLGACEPRRQLLQVRRQHLLDQLDDTVAAGAGRDPVGALLEHRQGVFDRDADLAFGQQRVVVLGVADPHGVVGG
jgi:hypothetical protein